MKRIVLAVPWQYLLIGVGSIFLVGIIQQETILSHFIVWGLGAVLLWQSWTRRRREKGRRTPRHES